MVELYKKFKGFKKTEYYEALMLLLENGQKAGINESVRLYQANSLDNEAIKRMATQIKILTEVIERISFFCDQAEKDEQLEELVQQKLEEGIIRWRV